MLVKHSRFGVLLNNAGPTRKKNTIITCCYHFDSDENGGAKSVVVTNHSYMLLGVTLRDERVAKGKDIMAKAAGTSSTSASKKQHINCVLASGVSHTLEATWLLGTKMGWIEAINPLDLGSIYQGSSPHSSEAFAKSCGFPHRTMAAFSSIGFALTKLAQEWRFSYKQIRRMTVTISAPLFIAFEDVEIQMDSWEVASSSAANSVTCIGFEMTGPDREVHLRQGCIELAALGTEALSSKL
eukprot:gnl/TRDRNA2_/TRDRNA2_73927_c0_seq1.p1 gnl/TRDRNA2_/TRDRNA2_73927_c0~~gnl/TRDRNA2_/TRDRNA2_73927_c0_seq1.p1  ORF type:complete len:240 (-),score=35.75 gnl/TRDRNA2_/TRDRNA2_73927_c0_seq1:234-953(-)